MAATISMTDKIQEVRENGAFLFHFYDATRDLDHYTYERISRAGKPLTGAGPIYALTVRRGLVWSCDCPQQQRLDADPTDDQHTTCKHIQCLQEDFFDSMRAARQGQEGQKAAPAGWDMLFDQPGEQPSDVPNLPCNFCEGTGEIWLDGAAHPRRCFCNSDYHDCEGK